MVAAVGTSSGAAAPMMDATSGKAAEKPAPASLPPEPVKAEPMKLHSLPPKAAQTTSVDSDADALGRVMQCFLTKVCPAFKPACIGKQSSAMWEASMTQPVRFARKAAGHFACGNNYGYWCVGSSDYGLLYRLSLCTWSLKFTFLLLSSHSVTQQLHANSIVFGHVDVMCCWLCRK